MDTLFALIMVHTDFMDHIMVSSRRLQRATLRGDMDTIEFESNNRERLINIIEQIQFTIEERLNAFSTQESIMELTPVLNAWANDLGLWYEKVGALDDETTQGLEELKEETQREIAVVYKNKEGLKGYNLNSLK